MMLKGKRRQNEGPCALCGQQGTNEKFRKLTENLLERVKQSPADAVQLQINDQLCANNRLKMRSQDKTNIVVAEAGIIEEEEELIESNKEEEIGFEESLHNNDELLDDSDENKLVNKENQLKKLIQIAETNYIYDGNDYVQSVELAHNQPGLNTIKESDNFSKLFETQISDLTKVLYNYQREGNPPILDVQEFINVIESREPKLKGLFNTLFLAMNPAGKNQQTKNSLYKKVMLLCYQIAGLRNKQISNVKTEIGLFMLRSGASTYCINTMANMGICSTYQTAFNKLEEIVKSHELSVQKYIKNHSNNLIIGCIDDYHNIHGTRIPSTTSIPQIAHMATVLFNTAEIPPIPFYSERGFSVHNFNGIDSVLLRTILWEQYMISFAHSYNFEKANWKWIRDIMFTNESDLIESLVVHSYDADIPKEYKRKFNQTKLIDLIQLDLKNMNNYIEAIKTFIGFVITRFGLSKDIGYRTFLDLLDNLIPATLDIYTILFRENHFNEYVSTVYRLWSVMKRFNRHNYDKILLAFISDVHYWRLTGHSIIDILENNLRQNNNFAMLFASERSYPYTKKDLDELAKATAIFLLDFFENIWKSQGQIEKRIEGKTVKKVYYYFPYIKYRFSLGALPLGYHSQTIPSQQKLCDRINCFETMDNKIKVLICGHAYHEKCFQLQEEDKKNKSDTDSTLQSDTDSALQSEDCDFDKAEILISKTGNDNQLKEKIA
ncbi:7440_t:CDS:2, partial [Scutellospora calospora]